MASWARAESDSSLELHRPYPRQTLAHVVGAQLRQFAARRVDAVDGQLARAFAGAEEVAAVRFDVEGARCLLGRRLAQGRELGGVGIDREAGQAVVAAVGDPDEL